MEIKVIDKNNNTSILLLTPTPPFNWLTNGEIFTRSITIYNNQTNNNWRDASDEEYKQGLKNEYLDKKE